MDKIQLKIKGISYSQTQTGSYALILEEIIGNRKLPIIVGNNEAQSIALALENNLTIKRPITHDLFVSLSRSFHINLKFMVIEKIQEGIFYSNLYFEDAYGNEKILDSRTSDAIALSIRYKTPIYTNGSVLEKAGIVIEMDDKNQEENNDTNPEEDWGNELESLNSLSEFSNLELENKLNEAIENEEYELAAIIRDELDKRQK